ncbi:KCNMA1 [Lepeophtheirus salmonis]|uniref:BK channel n=1 Tax=Lepeophtheirus salmonis TaxID=72036 RepID=A0A7R8CMP6_LEPSM|nr:KCNMA1 [Lepeophtheirus salmonis]CAF2868394.1 KCNMA1 [Lepeophtheirus salmonis]
MEKPDNETLNTDDKILPECTIRHWYIFVIASFTTMITLLFVVAFVRRINYCFKRRRRNEETSETSQFSEPFISSLFFAFSCSIFALGIYIYDVGNFLEMEREIMWTTSTTVQIDFGLSIFFVIYFIIRFVASEDKLSSLYSLESIVDYFYVFILVDRTWHGLRFLRALVIQNLSDVLVYLRLINTSSQIRLVKVTTIFISVILASAGVCHLLENSGDPWAGDCGFSNTHDPYLSFGSCIYFMFVTMSTVGYGDIFCTTDLGKIFIVMYMLDPDMQGNMIQRDQQFIIVCGNVNYESVTNFLEDFFHPARDDVDVEVVFLNKGEPDLEFEGLLKREHSRVQYFKGSMLNAYDLQRVKAANASACLVIANKFCEEPDAEDVANIMRVISLKNYCENTRVIIQLMHAELCLAPGFSTLVSNLVIMGDDGDGSKITPHWKQEYLNSSSRVVLAETLSPTFVGMKFIRAAEICYSKLNLLLLAIEERKYEGGEIYINPKDRIINANEIGLFITDSADSVKRAWYYCRKCHASIKNERQVTKCPCKRTAVRLLGDYAGKRSINKRILNDSMIESKQQQPIDLEGQSLNPNSAALFNITQRKRKKSQLSLIVEGSNQNKMKFDSTGMYHWCPAMDLSVCSMDRQKASMTVFKNHVVVAVFANPDSPLIGLRNLVMPLRASNIHYNDLIHIVIVGNAQYLQREWKLLQNMPKVHIFNGSPLSRADLRAVKIELCRMWPDKTDDLDLVEKRIVHNTHSKRSYVLSELVQNKSNETRPRKESSNKIPTIVDLAFASNVRFLDDDEQIIMDDVELHKTIAFASGHALARGILDSLLSTTYFNASALRLIRQWVTGGATIELELALAEGAGLQVIKDSIYSSLAERGCNFGELFVEAATKSNTLCIGIYRKRDTSDPNEDLRILISAPDKKNLILKSDIILTLQQFEGNKKKIE